MLDQIVGWVGAGICSLWLAAHYLAEFRRKSNG